MHKFKDSITNREVNVFTPQGITWNALISLVTSRLEVNAPLVISHFEIDQEVISNIKDFVFKTVNDNKPTFNICYSKDSLLLYSKQKTPSEVNRRGKYDDVDNIKDIPSLTNTSLPNQFKSMVIKHEMNNYSIDIAVNANWEMIVTTITKTLPLKDSGLRIISIALYDEYGDKISPSIDNAKKFWKFFYDHERLHHSHFAILSTAKMNMKNNLPSSHITTSSPPPVPKFDKVSSISSNYGSSNAPGKNQYEQVGNTSYPHGSPISNSPSTQLRGGLSHKYASNNTLSTGAKRIPPSVSDHLTNGNRFHYSNDFSNNSYNSSNKSIPFRSEENKSLYDTGRSRASSYSDSDPLGNTPLHKAILEKSDDLCLFLIDKGASLTVENNDNMTPLHMLCQIGNISLLRTIYNKIIFDVNLKNSMDVSLLHSAADSENDNVCLWLLSNKRIQINALDSRGRTPLHISCSKSHATITKTLVEKGAYVNAQDVNGETPLFHACLSGDMMTAQWLVSRGALIYIEDTRNNSCLHVVCNMGHEGLSKWLVECGADIHAKNINGLTPLDRAMRNNHNTLVKQLIQLESSIGGRETPDMKSFHDACMNGRLSDVMTSIDQGVDPNVVDKNMTTALHLTSVNGNFEIAAILIGAGVKVNALDQNPGISPLHIACSNGYIEYCQWLVQHGGANPMLRSRNQSTCLHYACESGNVTLVEWCLCIGIEPDTADYRGITALHEACRSAHLDIAKVLVSHGAKCEQVDYCGRNALHAASESGDLDVVKWVVELQKDLINTQDLRGRTPFLIACCLGYVDIAKWLVQNNANISVVMGMCDNRNNVLLECCQSGQLESVQYLCKELQVDMSVTNAANENVVQLAQKSGNEELVAWIRLNNSAALTTPDNPVPSISITSTTTASSNKTVASQPVTLQPSNAPDGASLIHGAAAAGDVGLLNVLLKKGISVNSATLSGYTPLHVACVAGKFDMVKTLLSEGADRTLKDCGGKTAADYAESCGHLSIYKLLDNGEKSTASSFIFQCLPVFHNSNNSTLSEIDDASFTTTATFQSNSVSTHESDINNNTIKDTDSSSSRSQSASSSITSSPVVSTSPAVIEEVKPTICELCSACQYGDIAAVNSILRRHDFKTLINKKCGVLQSTPIFNACEVGNINLVGSLVTNGADVNITNRYGMTALHIACEQGQEDIAMFLIRNGASANAKNSDENTPLHLLSKEGMTSVLQYLLDLPRSAMAQLDLETKNKLDQTILHFAVDGQSLAIVRLLSSNVKLTNSRDSDSRTPLHCASMIGNIDICECLLNANAFVNARDNDGMTPFLFACINGNLKLAKLLVNRGANAKVESDSVGNAMHIACSMGDVVLAKWLFQLGLNPFDEGNFGTSPASSVSADCVPMTEWLSMIHNTNQISSSTSR